MLDRVALLHPQHERLVGSYAVPGGSLIGVAAWPPNDAGLPSTWKDRRAVPGFRLAPGKKFVMVLGVVATATGRAIAQGMMIDYHASGGSYVTNSHLAVIIAVNKPEC